MSSVEFQAGLDALSAKKDSIELKLVAANAQIVDSGLLAWLNEAQRAGSLVTVTITAVAEDEEAEHQMRLFEELITEQAMRQTGRQAVASVVADIRRGRRNSSVAVSGGVAVAEDESAPEDYPPE